MTGISEMVVVLSKRVRLPDGWVLFSLEKLWNLCFSRSRIQEAVQARSDGKRDATDGKINN